jgi:hypothetical protein
MAKGAPLTYAQRVALILGTDPSAALFVEAEEMLLLMIADLRAAVGESINCSKCFSLMRRHCSNQKCEEFCG